MRNKMNCLVNIQIPHNNPLNRVKSLLRKTKKSRKLQKRRKNLK